MIVSPSCGLYKPQCQPTMPDVHLSTRVAVMEIKQLLSDETIYAAVGYETHQEIPKNFSRHNLVPKTIKGQRNNLNA